MMTAQILRIKFDEDLKKLQALCPHEKTKWMDYMWAPGHLGSPVQVCDRCEKILKQAITDNGIIPLDKYFKPTDA